MKGYHDDGSRPVTKGGVYRSRVTPQGLQDAKKIKQQEKDQTKVPFLPIRGA
jgi:hypothetical protein